MYENEEKKLHQIKHQYDETNIPIEIDTYIRAGIDQASNKKKRWRTTGLSTLAAGILLILMVTSIRISPAFASYVSQVPGLDKLVELVQGDKGLEAAVENEFVQKVGKSETQNGITFTVDEVIADESRIIVFYTLESEESVDYIQIAKLEVLNENGESLAGSLSYGGPTEGLSKGEEYKGSFDVAFKEGMELPEVIQISTGIQAGSSYESAKVLEDTWEITFDLDQEKFFGKEQKYQVNKTVTVENQQITFKEIIVYPTRVGVHVKYPESNSKELFSFDDLRIVNGDGEVWAGINNGVVSNQISDTEEVLWLQSNYFSKPEEFYIEFSSIRALDKEKLQVVVDLEQKKIIKKPNEQLELLDVSKQEGNIHVTFKVERSSEFDKNHVYEIFGFHYYDATGKEYENKLGTMTGSREDTLAIEPTYRMVDKDYTNPITLTISDYPTRITKEVRIKVK